MPDVTNTTPETMTVVVRDREYEDRMWGSGLYRPTTRIVTISAFCPVCGARRGTPRRSAFYEDGWTFSVDMWTNPCGHKDAYPDVIAEAERLAATPELDGMTSELIVEHYRCPKCERSLIETGFVFTQHLEVQTEYFVWWTDDHSAIRASYDDHMVSDDKQAPVEEATCGSCGTPLPTDVIAALEILIDR